MLEKLLRQYEQWKRVPGADHAMQHEQSGMRVYHHGSAVRAVLGEEESVYKNWRLQEALRECGKAYDEREALKVSQKEAYAAKLIEDTCARYLT